MPRNNGAFTEAFIDGLRRDTARWKSELSLLDAGDRAVGHNLETSELKSWLDASDAILARYVNRRTR